MSAFFDNAITDEGRKLWAEMQAGGSFSPTRIAIGSGYLPTGKTTRTVTDVVELVKSVPLNKSKETADGDYIFGGMFTNTDLTESFYYRELGLYAKIVRTDGTESDEVLYSYGNAGANAEMIPAYSAGSAVERQLDILTYIGNDASVVINIETGVYVTAREFMEEIARLDAADAALSEGLNTLSDSLLVRLGQLENHIEEVLPPLAADITAIYGRLDEADAERKTLGDAVDAHSNDIAALNAEDDRIESLTVENAAKVDALWDALLTDITENPAQVNFDDLTGITLTGGVWNAAMRRLEV